MKKITIDKSKCESYKTFYEIVYNEFYGKRIPDWEDYNNMHYSADMLNEFLWYVNDRNTEFVMVNFDINKIKEQKTLDNYKWNIILEVLEDFVKDYPNNKLTFKTE